MKIRTIIICLLIAMHFDPVSKDNSLSVKNCFFTNNNGGILVSDSTRGNFKSTITSCTFTNNKADNGGAIFKGESGQMTVNKCTFTNNKAKENGGAIWTYPTSEPGDLKIIGCTFKGNTAGKGTNNVFGSYSGIV